MTSNFALKPSVAVADADSIPSTGNSKGIRLDPTRLLSAGGKQIDFAVLEALAGRSILSASQFDRKTILELCKFASLLEVSEIASHHPLDGKLVVTAFFEASTRTRLSFESAVLRLDGKIVSVPDGKVTGVAKGESLSDIGEMLNTYGDLVVMRHPVTSSVYEVRENLVLPLVNAGNGSGEHPTQALIDWYTLLKWRPELQAPCPPDQRIHLGVVGTPGSMRSVKSFVMMGRLFEGSVRKLTVVSEMADPFGPELAQSLAGSSIEVQTTTDLPSVIGDFDVLYMNSIAFLGDTYRHLDSRFSINASTPLKEDAVVMHPLARNAELDRSLDATHHNLYFAQAASAVYIRQALLIALLGRISSLPASVLLLTS